MPKLLFYKTRYKRGYCICIYAKRVSLGSAARGNVIEFGVVSRERDDQGTNKAQTGNGTIRSFIIHLKKGETGLLLDTYQQTYNFLFGSLVGSAATNYIKGIREIK